MSFGGRTSVASRSTQRSRLISAIVMWPATGSRRTSWRRGGRRRGVSQRDQSSRAQNAPGGGTDITPWAGLGPGLAGAYSCRPADRTHRRPAHWHLNWHRTDWHGAGSARTIRHSNRQKVGENLTAVRDGARPGRRITHFEPNCAYAIDVEALLRLIDGYPGRSTVRDHDLSEMPAALEMPVGCLGLSEGECPVDYGAQMMQRDGPVHRLEISAAADADCPDRKCRGRSAIRGPALSPMATGLHQSGSHDRQRPRPSKILRSSPAHRSRQRNRRRGPRSVRAPSRPNRASRCS
jgi:hypothetical protein